MQPTAPGGRGAPRLMPDVGRPKQARGKCSTVASPRSARYTSDMRKARAKPFRNGGSDVVRLQGMVADDRREVRARRKDQNVIRASMDKDKWSSAFRAYLGAWPRAISRVRQRDPGERCNPLA